MLHKLELHSFRAFDRFTVTFGPDAFMVGANNAGKSTIVAAVRAIARMLAIAKNRRPDGREDDKGRSYPVYRFATEAVDLARENLRYEFRNQETRIEAFFKGGASVRAVWPPASEEQEIWEVEPYFYLAVQDRTQPTTAKEARSLFPVVGVIPVLGPLETVEPVRAEKYVRESVDTRLASRHFRNQLLLLESEAWPWGGLYDAYQARIEEWAPETTLSKPRIRIAPSGTELDVFYEEEGSRSEKELAWAGDGIQVWLQVLFQLYRLNGPGTVVLDEPDVYLHPDLQRRLVHLLESHPAQTVTATHSPEMLGEANPESVIWIDKSKVRARRGPRAAELTSLATAIGSQFNIRLAKALRSRVVLFVEGKDMRIFRTVAKRIGAKRVAEEHRITVVPLEGFTNWRNVEPFSWLTRNLLEDTVLLQVVLDRDYKPEEAVRDVLDRLESIDVVGHVWERKELESYLLVPASIARASGCDAEAVAEELQEIATSLRDSVLARRLDAAQEYFVDAKHHRVTVMEDAQRRFHHQWSDPATRLAMCPAKDVLAALNLWLQQHGYKAISSRSIAGRMSASEVPIEMVEFIQQLESQLAAH